MKICKTCGIPKEVSEFYSCKTTVDKLLPSCKSCHKKVVNDYKTKNRDKVLGDHVRYRVEHADEIRVKNLEYQRKNPFKVKAFQANRRTRVKSAEGCHTDKDIKLIYEKQNGLCAYCGAELNGVFEVDHIKPLSKGGSNWPWNLACSCVKCNRTKSNKYAS